MIAPRAVTALSFVRPSFLRPGLFRLFVRPHGALVLSCVGSQWASLSVRRRVHVNNSFLFCTVFLPAPQVHERGCKRATTVNSQSRCAKTQIRQDSSCCAHCIRHQLLVFIVYVPVLPTASIAAAREHRTRSTHGPGHALPCQ